MMRETTGKKMALTIHEANNSFINAISFSLIWLVKSLAVFSVGEVVGKGFSVVDMQNKKSQRDKTK